MNSRSALACWAVLVLSSLAFTAAVRAEDPRVVVFVKSADDLMADLKHLCGDLAGRRTEWENNVWPNLDSFLFGFEGARPFRCDQLIGGKTGRRNQLMAPVDNLNDFINDLALLGINARQDPQDKHLYSLGGGVWVRVTAGYAVFADADHLDDIPANMPAPSDSHAELLKQGYDGAARLDNSRTTPEQRTAAFAALRKNTLGDLQKRSDETAEAFALRKVRCEQSLEIIQRLFVESSLVTIGLTIDSGRDIGTGKFMLAALPDTPLAETLQRQAQQPSRFSGVAKPEGSVLAARINATLSEMSIRQLPELYKLMKTPLQQQIDRTEGLTDDQKRARKEIAGLVLDMLTTSLDLGKCDGLAQIASSAGGRHTELLALCVRDCSPVTKILELLPASVNGCKTELNVDRAGDFAIHKLTLGEAYPKALREFFGDSDEVFIGAGPDALWVSFGDGAIETLKAGIAAAAKSPEGEVDPTVASLDLDLQAVLQLVNRWRADEGADDEDRRADTALIPQDGDNYRLRIDLKRIEDRLEGDVSFQSGILKAIGEAIVDYAKENLG